MKSAKKFFFSRIFFGKRQDKEKNNENSGKNGIFFY